MTHRIVLFGATGFTGRLLAERLAAQGAEAMLARRPEDSSVRYLRGVAVETATTPPQAIQLDGDEFGEAIRMRCRIVEGGLKTVFPKGHDVSGL